MLSHGGTERELSRGQTSPRRTGSVADLDPRPFDPVREGPSKADLNRADRIHSLELEVENLKEEQKKHKRHDARLVIGSSVATAALVVGGQALLSKVFADEPTPQTTDISSVPGGTSFTDETLQPIEKFDNSADHILVSKNNTTVLPLQEVSSQLGIDREKSVLTMTFPYELPDGRTITFEREPSNWESTEELLREVKEKDIKHDSVTTLPPNTIIKAPSFMEEEPTEYRAMLFLNPNDPNKIGGVRVFAYYPKENVTIVAWFFSRGKDPSKLNFERMIPIQEDVNWSGEGWKKLPAIKPDAPLVKTITDQKVEMDLKVYKGQKVGGLAEVQDKALIPITPYFPTYNGRLALTPSS